jgi:maltokinase
MHLHLSRIFPVGPSETVAGSWEGLIESIRRRLASASGALGRDLEGLVASLLERVSGLEGPGPVIRVHGDLHLGQVMRTDLGWFVLDFEGEPDRSLAERLAPASPLKDVAGMLRSLHYASRYSLGERDRSEWGHLHSAALAWEQRNREAFLAGYESQPGIEVLLPDAYAMSDVMSVYELDKALYELAYELAHRPEWVEIPMDALERLGLPDERSID